MNQDDHAFMARHARAFKRWSRRGAPASDAGLTAPTVSPAVDHGAELRTVLMSLVFSTLHPPAFFLASSGGGRDDLLEFHAAPARGNNPVPKNAPVSLSPITVDRTPLPLPVPVVINDHGAADAQPGIEMHKFVVRGFEPVRIEPKNGDALRGLGRQSVLDAPRHVSNLPRIVARRSHDSLHVLQRRDRPN